MIIAVDGPLASGKGTIAKKLSGFFDVPYLDTGLLYRATARAALSAGLLFDDETGIAIEASQLTLPIADPAALRTAEIGAAASKVAALPEVRAALLQSQRQFSRLSSGAVLDGRDIGTVVCPNADVKLWITASEEERARRRRLELTANGQAISQEEMLSQLRERDARDAGRSDAPMQMAADAHLIDTSDLSIETAFQVARERVEQVLAEQQRT